MYQGNGIKEFNVYGSKVPTEKEASPQIFLHNLFAKNEIVARSRFNNVMRTQYKIKASATVILRIEEVVEDTTAMKVKNYGIKLVCRSRRGGLHNMYKEFRAVSRCEAVNLLLNDMGSRHKAKRDAVRIVSINELAAADLRRPRVIEFAQDNVVYPVFKKEINTKDAFVAESTDIFH